MTVDVTTRPRTLESYVGGEWVRGTGKGQTLLDAATGDPVAQIDSSGLDFAAALAYGRDDGRPDAAQALLPRARAMLKALGQHLMARKEEFYARASPPAPPAPTAGSTSRAASARCSPTPPRAAASCPTPASSSTATSSRCPRTAPSSASTSSPRSKASPSTSTPSTSRSGACWRSSRRPCSPACPRSSSRPARPPT